MKKQILITNGHLHIGGVEKSLVNFLNAIDYSKYCVDLVLFEGLGEYISEIPEEVNVILCDLTKTYGSALHVLKHHLLDLVSIKRKLIITLANKVNPNYLKYLLKTKEYDYALAYRVGTPMDFVSYGVKARHKYFWWHHGEFHYPDYLLNRWQNAARNMEGLICVSCSVKEKVEPYFAPFVKKINVIPNMISSTELLKKADQECLLDKTGFIMVSVGRFSDEKHMYDCIPVSEKLIRDGYVNFKWYLLGDGPQREQVIKEVKDKKLKDYIYCKGNISNPYPYIRQADLVVHPSFIESQGMTVLEAMALGKLIAVVGSDGVKEYAEDNVNALVSEMNIDSLAAKIEEAINLKDNDRIRICSNAKNTAMKYCPEAIMEMVERYLFTD